MTIQAGTHRVLDQGLGRGRPRHVAVASAAVYMGAVMGRMLEPHQGGWVETIDALPGYFAFAGVISRKLLNFRFRGRQLSVAQHTFANRGNRRGSARVGGTVAVEAAQSERGVLLV